MHTEAREDSVSIAINDTGPGVPLEYRERVFDKFFRIEHHREGAMWAFGDQALRRARSRSCA